MNSSTLSGIATVEVIPGFLDTLIAQRVPTEQREFSDDPDKDGIINAYEFLSRTDANDPSSGEPPLVEIEMIDSDSYLVYTFVVEALSHLLYLKPSLVFLPRSKPTF